MSLSTEHYLLVVFIGIAVGWIAHAMAGSGLLKNIIWGIAGAVIGAFMLPQAGVSFNFSSPMANFTAFTGLGAVFCALMAQVLR